MSLLGYGEGWAGSLLKHSGFSCFAWLAKGRGKKASPAEEDALIEEQGKGAIRGLCWQRQLMWNMKAAFAPGSIADFCQGISFFMCFSRAPIKCSVRPCAVLWAQQENVSGNEIHHEELPAVQQYYLSNMPTSSSPSPCWCLGILRDSSFSENNKSCRALLKVWLGLEGVKERPQVLEKSGPEWV